MKKYIAFAFLVVTLSCTNAQKDHETSAGEADVKTGTEVELTDAVDQDIYDGYISLKNALVASGFEGAKTAAQSLKAGLEKREGCESTALLADQISKAPDLAAQRKQFTALSTDLIALFKHASLSKGEIYVQHCPMANSGEGGDWLASEKNIRNPYYGDEMMECGSVVEEIKAKK
ncbi:DUF3347 domain-containing protein [Pedobacter deserti]|uniref:DUF3347 domain-containing protein n=1 Tax=Pedobacter deserti TaxID=2817382 RepID=UPI00210D9F9F|nr:DUF3347 domain-containing protein [Pedobacter sp. SYSU D00382]